MFGFRNLGKIFRSKKTFQKVLNSITDSTHTNWLRTVAPGTNQGTPDTDEWGKPWVCLSAASSLVPFSNWSWDKPGLAFKDDRAKF